MQPTKEVHDERANANCGKVVDKLLTLAFRNHFWHSFWGSPDFLLGTPSRTTANTLKLNFFVRHLLYSWHYSGNVGTGQNHSISAPCVSFRIGKWTSEAAASGSIAKPHSCAHRAKQRKLFFSLRHFGHFLLKRLVTETFRSFVLTVVNPAQDSWILHYPEAVSFVTFTYVEKC